MNKRYQFRRIYATLVFFVGIILVSRGITKSEDRIVSIPLKYEMVSFSKDGMQVAFCVKKESGFIVKEKKYCVVVNGQEEKIYDNITPVQFSPKGNHYYYGGCSLEKWYLVQDGKEIIQLGTLASLSQAAGYLNLIGSEWSVKMWQALPIWFAETADDYFVVSYPNEKGNIFMNGNWLKVEFNSFCPDGMAISPDGKHYSFALAPIWARSKIMNMYIYIDGLAGKQFESIDNAIYLQPGNRFIYRGKWGDSWTLMEGKKPLKEYGSLAGNIIVSEDHSYLATLVEKKPDKQAVVVDGKEEPAFPKVAWGNDLLSNPVSFIWSKNGLSHAYVAYLTDKKDSPMAVVYNGKILSARAEIRNSSLSLSPDGKHVAYAAKDGGKWTIFRDEVPQEQFEEVGNPVFIVSNDKVAYAAKTPKGWIIKGITDSSAFLKVGPLVAGPEDRIAYAAQIQGDKWQVFLNNRGIAKPYDGIVAQTGIHFEADDSVRFVAKYSDKLIWITGK